MPVICTGGFQTASVVAAAIERGDCDGVTIGRPLIANPDLVQLWQAGHDRPPQPVHVLEPVPDQPVENPLGCYDRQPLRVARRDGARDPLRLRPAAVRVTAAIFEPLRVPEPHGQEPRPALEHLRALRQLRRIRHPDAHQLGAEVRPRRRRRDHLLLVRRRPARVHRPQLRGDRPRRDDPVLARARRARPRARLQVHPPARARRPAARHPRARPRPEGAQLDGQVRSAARLRGRAGDARAAARDRGRVRRRRAPRARGRARRRRDPRRERLPLHAVPLVGDQRPQATSTAARSRTARASCSRPCAPCAPRSATTSTSR